jgi:hypothetical protein
MKIWKDIFTGDAMVSTDFRHKELFLNSGLEVKAKFTNGSIKAPISNGEEAIKAMDNLKIDLVE